MSELKQWLDDQSLIQYFEAFSENDIDFELLGELTESDLTDLGLSLGHRKKLLKALRASTNNSEPVANPQIQNSPSADVPKFSSEAEKRFLSVMFCDLADSTRLAAHMDMEDMHELNRAYQSLCSTAIEKFNGYVARFMGDGVLAYFGYPTAQENDAERALLAGLEIVHSMKVMAERFTLPEDISLSVRIGIASGLVVVESIGEGLAGENAVVGEAPNLAARMQGLAPANSVLIGPDTYRLVEKNFDLKTLGTQDIKGYEHPLETWQVIGPHSIDRGPLQNSNTYLTPLIGREEEQGLLQTRWKRSQSGEGQMVLLSGEAGIGKTRLIDSMLSSVSGKHRLIRVFCSPSHQQSPLYPFISAMLREAGAVPGDSNAIRTAKLSELLISRHGYNPSLLNTLLSLASLGAQEAKIEGSDPQHLLHLLQEKIVDSMVLESEFVPVLLIIEDTHWMDASSRKVIDFLAERIEFRKMMVLASFRSEKPLHYSFSNVTNLSLSNFTREQSEQLIKEITSKSGLDASVLKEISEKSGGIPLFLEEVSKSLLNVISTSDGPGGSPKPSIAIPDTLQASLLSTLDQLGEAKALAQFGSVIGNTFEKSTLEHLSILEHLYEKTNNALESDIDSLIKHRITVRDSGGENYKLRFRHALLRDAAYESVLKNTRKNLHGMIANYLNTSNVDDPSVTLALIAHHYERAEIMDQAFINWLNAGEVALNSGATEEAVNLLSRAYDLLNKSNSHIENLEDIYKLHMCRGRALNAAFGAISKDARESFTAAVNIAEDLKNIELQVDALDYLFGIIFNAGLIRESLEPAQKMLEIGARSNYPLATISGLQGLGMAHCTLGEFKSAADNLKKALVYRNSNIENINCYPSMTLDYLSYVTFIMGDADTAEDLCTDALESAQAESEYATVIALSNTCFTQMMLGNYERVTELATRAVDQSRERGQLMVFNRSSLFLNLSSAWIHRDKEALEKVVDSIGRLYQAGEYVDLTYLIGMTAELQIHLEQYNEAESTIEQALQLSEETEENFYKPELLRLKAEQIFYSKNHKEFVIAQQAIEDGIALAERQNAQSWINRLEKCKSDHL